MLYNAQTYVRPGSIEEARQLLQRADLKALALYDDLTTVDPVLRAQVDTAVDMSALGLASIEHQGASLHIGATTPLQTIIDEMADTAGDLLAKCARQTASWHVRLTATVGGLLTGGMVNAPIRLALDALGARVVITGQDGPLPLADLRLDELAGEIILAVIIDLAERPIGAAYEQVGRTPKDLPIVNAAAVVRSGQNGAMTARVSIGGVVDSRLLRLGLAQVALSDFDGLIDEFNGPLLNDHLGSTAYRQEMARVLGRRVLTDALAQVGLSAS